MVHVRYKSELPMGVVHHSDRGFRADTCKMADYLDHIQRIELADRVLRREAVLRDRLNPFTYYHDDDFRIRYRLGKDAVLHLLTQISHIIEGKQVRATTVPPYIQLVIALRFYATGAFLRADGDLFGIHESSVSRIIRRVFYGDCFVERTVYNIPHR